MMKKKNDRNLQKKRIKVVYDLICSKNYVPMREKEIAALLEVPRSMRKDLMQVLSILEAQGKIEINSRGRYQKASGRKKSEKSPAEQKEYRYKGNKRTHRSRGNKIIDRVMREENAVPGESGVRRRNPERTDIEKMPEQQRTEEFRNALKQSRDQIRYRNDEPGADITEIVLAYGLPTRFPEKVERQADACPDGPIEADYEGRTDLRGLTCVTIDGDDSKDFDDAVSLERDGAYFRLGVHIADVSNYVQASSALDREALKRGTSVYLCDRVIPMLPEHLSNGTCSLNEGEDRLTLSCLMKVDASGRIVDSRIVESVICSSRRLTYRIVDQILDGDTELKAQYADLVPMLFLMQKVSGLLRARRNARGAINFDFPEPRIVLDENGKPVSIDPVYATPATRLIEDFMLAANETVAKTYFDKKTPFLYRTHEDPDEDSMEDALSFVRKQGFKVRKSGEKITPAEVEAIIRQVSGTPEESLISTILLRSMKQARYSTECVGHFGLAAKYYCHFTSPIRRYPDLQIHRIIKDDLRGRLNDRKRGYYRRILDDVAWRSSALERRAVEVERETNKLKMAEFVMNHLGEESAAVISGVTGWGFYVQLPNTIEGLVSMHSLRDDYYEYDEQNYCIRGKDHGKTYTMGQPVRVKAIRADPARRIIDFMLLPD